MKKNGGSLPDGYKSAFDKWKAKQPKKVAPLLDDAGDDDEEFEETRVPVWAITDQCCGASFRHPNPFDTLLDDDDSDDDEAKVLNALQSFSSNIKSGPKLSQRDRKSHSLKPLDKKIIASIAKQVRARTLNLPDIDLESNEEYEAIWALVDSGAARSCAKRREHFRNTKLELEPSDVRMATASGEELKSRGCFRLDAFSSEGNPISQVFEDADVDMPIMAVGELSTNGDLGSNVLFRKNDGDLIDIKTNAVSKFVRRKGVYFMRIYVPRDNRQSPGFQRPGTA